MHLHHPAESRTPLFFVAASACRLPWRISDKAEADALKGACEAETAVCVSLTREKKTAAPPKLFDLTSVQREANRIFGYTAKQTLDPVSYTQLDVYKRQQ